MEKKIKNLVKEIQINENLRSMRQVFERYPFLGELYYKELQGEDIDIKGLDEKLKESKKLILG